MCSNAYAFASKYVLREISVGNPELDGCDR